MSDASPAPLSDAEYGIVQQQLVLLARITADLPLPAFLDRLATAEALGAILDPTLYVRGADRLQAVREIAEAAQRFAHAVAGPLETLSQVQTT